MTTEEALIVELFIKKVSEACGLLLSNESIETINHYLNHAEYEMAFEILFTEIIGQKEKLNIDWNKAIETGELLKLNKHTVYDVGFWDAFKTYSSKSL